MTKTIGIVADNWKLDTFKAELTKNGFKDFKIFPFTGNTSTIKIEADENDVKKVGNICRLVEMNLKRSN
ncbi:hypothetical protein LZD49_12540 [Dyadobacter sp. CY261]|uniref:hypothetical protein n=1 Tax=Dyadobacter sp. CY261 TaxID=2907203 RepID=UPI001F246E1A|nr:hypothetical protein [Dyadobacter sp. CY261]MCF0071301.1 hypothetical protein [Dyadobacter sp. CY261]